MNVSGGDLSAGVVRQRRELYILPSARMVLLDDAGLADEHALELADYMRDNRQTEVLQLGRNEFTDLGAAALADALGSCCVQRLSLAGNNLEDGTAAAIARALGAGFAPQGLDLSDNMITDEGVMLVVQAAAAHGALLRWLDLRLNPLSEKGRAAAAAAADGTQFELQV